MILRVFRARVIPGRAGDLGQFVRAEAIAQVLKVPGLLSFQPAIRTDPSGQPELLVTSTWRKFDALIDTGQDLASPIAMPLAGPFLEPGTAEHYELVIGETRDLPMPGGIVRVMRARLTPNAEGPYFTHIRDAVGRHMDDDGMVAVQVGRRAVETVNEAVVVTRWADQRALEASAGPHEVDPAASSTTRFFLEPPEVRFYEPMMVAELWHGR